MATFIKLTKARPNTTSPSTPREYIYVEASKINYISEAPSTTTDSQSGVLGDNFSVIQVVETQLDILTAISATVVTV